MCGVIVTKKKGVTNDPLILMINIYADRRYRVRSSQRMTQRHVQWT